MVPGFVLTPLVTSPYKAVAIPIRRLLFLHDLGRCPRHFGKTSTASEAVNYFCVLPPRKVHLF
jgi:hypothetical protein